MKSGRKRKPYKTPEETTREICLTTSLEACRRQEENLELTLQKQETELQLEKSTLTQNSLILNINDHLNKLKSYEKTEKSIKMNKLKLEAIRLNINRFELELEKIEQENKLASIKENTPKENTPSTAMS